MVSQLGEESVVNGLRVGSEVRGLSVVSGLSRVSELREESVVSGLSVGSEASKGQGAV